jgi:hypothetical protein
MVLVVHVVVKVQELKKKSSNNSRIEETSKQKKPKKLKMKKNVQFSTLSNKEQFF